MEHRRGHRLNTTQAVSISTHLKLLGHFFTRDISAGGLSVTDIDGQLSKGDFIYLNVNSGAPLNGDGMKAIVVYRDKQKVGLMWADHYPNISSFLQEMQGFAA
jgi:hypothetical protein